MMISVNPALQSSDWNMLVALGPHHQMDTLSFEPRSSREHTWTHSALQCKKTKKTSNAHLALSLSEAGWGAPICCHMELGCISDLSSIGGMPGNQAMLLAQH